MPITEDDFPLAELKPLTPLDAPKKEDNSIPEFSSPDVKQAHQSIYGRDAEQEFKSTPTKIDQSWFDVTAGAAAHGAAQTGEMLAKKVGMDDIAYSLKRFQENNPEYAPQQVNSALALITSPKSLASHIFGGAPQFVGTAALLGIPYAGIPLAMGLNYAIDSQQTHDDAIAHGAPEDIADHAGQVSGVVAAGLQLLPEIRMFKAMTGGEKYLAREAYANASKALIAEYGEGKVAQEVIHQYGIKAIGDVLKREISPELATELLSSPAGLSGFIANKITPTGWDRTRDAAANAMFVGEFGAIAGGAGEMVHRASYGAYLPDFSWSDFFSQRAQEALTGAGSAVFLGVPIGKVQEALARRRAGQINYSHPELDMFSREQFQDHMTKHLTDPEQAQAAEIMLDTIFKTHADKNGLVSREKAMNQLNVLDIQGRDVDSEPLAQTAEGLGGFFSRLEKLISSEEFEKSVGAGRPARELLRMFEKSHMSAEELKLTGIRDYLTEMGEQKVGVDEVRQALDGRYVEIVTQIHGEQAAEPLFEKVRELQRKRDEIGQLLEGSRNNPERTPEAAAKHQELATEWLKNNKNLLDYREAALSRTVQHPEIFPPGLDSNKTEIIVTYPKGKNLEPDAHYPEVPNYVMDISLGSGKAKLPTGEEVPVRAIIENQSDTSRRLQEWVDREKFLKDFLERSVNDPKISENDRARAKERLQEAEAKKPDAPFIEKTKDQIQHGIKQALLNAVENGFKYFGLPDSQQVADRWHTQGEPDWQGLLNKYEMHNTIAEKLFRRYDPQHTGRVTAELVGGKDEHGLLAQIPILEITPKVRDQVLRGQPLFQTKDLHSFVNDVSSRTGQFGAKALLDKTGHVYVSSAEDHAQIMNELRKTHGLEWKDIEATGWVHTLPDDKEKTVFFAGDSGGAAMYRPMDMAGPTKFYNFHLTEPKQYTIIQPKERLAQATKASTTFVRMVDGMTKAFVSFENHADLTSVMHEIAHVLTKFSSPEERALMSQIVGREWGHWGVPEWESIAKQFEQYFVEGKAPNMKLQPVFDTMEKAFKDVYRITKDSPALTDMHPFARELFDNWIDRDDTDPAVLSARGKLRDALANAKDVETNWSETENYEQIKSKYDAAVVEASNELQRAQISKRSKESEVARRKDLSKVSETALSTMPPQLGKVHRALNYVTEGMLKLVSFERYLKRNPAGEETMQRLTDMDSRKKFLTAPFHIEAVDGMNEMSNAQKADLQVVLPGNGIAGFAKVAKIFDRQQPDALPVERGTAVGKVLRAYAKGKYAANKAFEQAGGYRWIAGGYQPVNAGENRVDKDMSNLRMTRLMHPETRAAFASGDEAEIAPRLQAIVDSNPDQYKGIADLEQLRKLVTEWATKPDIRRSASLENGRIIDNMPTHFKDLRTGEWKPLLVTDLRELVHGTFNAEFNRVAMIEQFGQSDLQKAKLDDWKSLAKILKKQSEPDIDILRDRIAARSSPDGYPLIDPERLKELDYGTLKKVAKQNDVDVHVGQEEYAKWLDTIKAADFYDANRKVDKDVDSKLRAFAKEIGGITTSRNYAPFTDVLEEVKSRMKEVPVDLVKDLRTAFTRQGGEGKTFDTVMQLGQGIQPWSTSRGFWSNSWDVVRGLLAAAHTSLSAPFYLSQSVNALKYAMAGWEKMGALKGALDFSDSLQKVILHPGLVKSQAMTMGVFLDLPNMMVRDYGVKSVGQFIQNMAYKGLGMHAIDMVNYSLAGEIGARLAERWNVNGIEPREIGLARTLRLNAADIKTFNEHGMTPELKAKVAQNVADNTMIYTASPVKKGLLENHPILKLLFAYNSYSTGMARYFLNHFVDDFKVSFKTPQGAASWMTKTVSTLGAFVGAGMLTQILQQAIRGNVSKEPDEDTMKKMGIALLDIGLLGPTQRVLSAFQYDGGSSEKAFAAAMPQFKFVIDTLGALISNKYFPQGKYANYDLIPRVAKTVADSIPITRAYKQWETNVAFPESELYNKVSAETFKYDEDKERGLGVAKLASQQAENPLTKPVVLALQHYDLQGAQDAIKVYYSTQIQRLSDPLWIKAGLTPQKIQEELHSTLMSHAPLQYHGWELGDFLSHFNPQMQSSFLMADAKYRAYVNAIAPSSNVH